MEAVNGLERINAKSKLQNIREKIDILDNCLVWALGTMTVTRSEAVRNDLTDYFVTALKFRFMQTDAVGFIKGDTNGETVRRQRFENVKRNVWDVATKHNFQIPRENLDNIWTGIHEISVARQNWIKENVVDTDPINVIVHPDTTETTTI